jgi:hypothetical protein
MPQNRYKVSGTGWLCVEDNGRWVPIFKLTPAQLAAWNNIHGEQS